MRHSARGYANAALVLTNVIARILLVELEGHRFAAELTFKFLKAQHMIQLASKTT